MMMYGRNKGEKNEVNLYTQNDKKKTLYPFLLVVPWFVRPGSVLRQLYPERFLAGKLRGSTERNLH